ncbi:MAG: ABC transporter permease [Proteobacteria bacterium]|nr:ABC transporter permease [Pseudomonadota bacterium]
MSAEALSAPKGAPLKAFYWSVRRELWEHPSIWMAQVGAGAVVLVGYVISLPSLPHLIRSGAAAHKAGVDSYAGMPYMLAAAAVGLAGWITAMLYCAAALHGERRDRSLLFWKSLPISDPVAVMAKAALPMLVTPVVTVVLVLALHIVMVLLASPVAMLSGAGLQAFFDRIILPRVWFELIRGIPMMALWYAPIYGWLILASGWAKRLPILWAVAPPLAVALLEKLAFNTTIVWDWLKLRAIGPFAASMQKATPGHPHPTDFASPHLWIGLALAAAFIVVAVRLRRVADPI